MHQYRLILKPATADIEPYRWGRDHNVIRRVGGLRLHIPDAGLGTRKNVNRAPVLAWNLCKKCDDVHFHIRPPVAGRRADGGPTRPDHPECMAAAAAEGAERRRVYLAGKARPCTDCGVEYPPPVMQYDHLPERGAKVADISHMARNPGGFKKGGAGLAAIIAEIAKCEVVCANCHAMRSWRRLSDPQEL